MRVLRVFCAFFLVATGLALAPTVDAPAAGAADETPRAVMVSGSTRLPAGDRAIHDIVVDLGFDLTIVDDDSDLDGLSLDGVDVVLISTSVVPSKVGATFTNAPVPIVVWEPELFDELRLWFGGDTTFNYSSIEIVAPDHPIAAGHDAGPVRVYSSAKPLARGSASGEADIIAHVPGRPFEATIFAYETGDRMAWSERAPAPRVALFPSYAGSKRLSAAGRDLIGAAIEWAVDAPGPTVPANDDFADRTPIIETATGSTTGATLEAGEPRPFALAFSSVWWTWTAPEDGTATISVETIGFDPYLAVWTGDLLPSLQLVAADDLGLFDEVYIDAVEGETYQIAVYGFRDQQGQLELSVDLDTTAGPVNDDFADRLPLDGTATGSNVGATLEPDERGPDDIERSSVWWTWTAPTSGIATITTAGSDFDNVLSVSAADAFPRVERITSGQSIAQTATVTFEATEGERYELGVYGLRDAQGSIELSAEVVATPPPPNDDFNDRAPFTVATTGTTAGASTEDAEPLPDLGDPNGSVWWTWTAPRSATATLIVDATEFTPALAVWAGDELVSLDLVAAGSWYRTSDGTRRADASFSAVAGTTYQVAVYGQGLGRGPVELLAELDETGAPPNDDFADRLTLVDTTSGTNVGATIEPGEPLPDRYADRADTSIWWTWTAQVDGTVTFDTLGSQIDTILAVWAGGELDELGLVAANDDRFDSEYSLLSFEASAGEAYQIAVYGKDLAQGDVALSITPAPVNDDFADRLTLVGSATGTNVGATLEEGEPVPDELSFVSVWWTWTAPETGSAVVTVGGEFRPQLAVWSGDEFSSLELIGSDLFAADPSVTFDAVAGEAYQIALYGHLDDQGSFELRARLASDPRSAVMIAGSTRPPAGDVDIIGLVEAAGFDVTVIDDDSDLMALDLSEVDLVLISTSVVATKVGDVFADAPVPIIVWEAQLFDDLDLTISSGETPASQQNVEIVDTGHPLAAGLDGTPQVYTAPRRLSYGMPDREAEIIAREPGRPNRVVVFAYDTGSTMVDRNVAPAPRVALFPSYDGARRLAPAGEALIAAALAWI